MKGSFETSLEAQTSLQDYNPTFTEPSVPLMTASLANRAPMEKAQTAILFLENFITTTTVSSTPDADIIFQKSYKKKKKRRATH